MASPERIGEVVAESLPSKVAAVAVPAPKAQTYEEALQGQAGVDYLPDDACPVCGRMAYLNRGRYTREHDSSKHGKPKALLVTEAGSVVELERRIDRAARARRSVDKEE